MWLWLACADPSWTLDLHTAEAPLAVRHVRASYTTAARLGSGTTTFTSDSPKNSVHFELEVEVREGFHPDGLLATRSACRAGDRVWATPFTGDGGLMKAQPGEVRTTSSEQFMPNAFAAGPPQACEVQLRYQYGLAGPEPFAPVDLGRFCWTEQGLTEGACPAEALGRVIPAAPLAGGPYQALWEGGQLGLRAAVTVGQDWPREGIVHAAAACVVGGKVQQGSLTIAAGLRDYEPGDNFVIEGAAPFDGPPDSCTLEIRHVHGSLRESDLAPSVPRSLRSQGPRVLRSDSLRSRIEPGARPVPVFTLCLEAGQTRPGACNGLPIGPVTLRIDAQFRATLVRGTYVEGPFELGPAPTADDLRPVLEAMAHDDAVIVAVPGTMSQESVAALLDALEAHLGDKPVSLSTAQ